MVVKTRDWKSERIVSIDFDGVISVYDGWKGANHLGKPIKGAKGFIEKLIKWRKKSKKVFNDLME